MSLNLVFVYAEFCAFILKAISGRKWGGGGAMVAVADVLSLVCLAGHLSFMEHAARAPLLCPGPVSDGQFYSPPESLAGQLRL